MGTFSRLVLVLLAAGVPFTRWIRFVFGAVLLTALVGVIAIAAVVWLQLM